MRILEIELQDEVSTMLEILQEQYEKDTGQTSTDEQMISALIRNGYEDMKYATHETTG